MAASPSPAYRNLLPGVEGDDAPTALDDAGLSTLLGALPSGVGGGLGRVDDPDTRKFRRDKLSRLFRLQRGTRCFRFTLLFLVVLIVISGYFQFDLPAITVNRLLEKLNIGRASYAAMFIGYSVANTIVPLLSGPFFSRGGKWRGVTIIATVITLGVGIVYIGIVTSSFAVMVVGRSVFGIGGESVFVGVE